VDFRLNLWGDPAKVRESQRKEGAGGWESSYEFFGWGKNVFRFVFILVRYIMFFCFTSFEEIGGLETRGLVGNVLFRVWP